MELKEADREAVLSVIGLNPGIHYNELIKKTGCQSSKDRIDSLLRGLARNRVIECRAGGYYIAGGWMVSIDDDIAAAKVKADRKRLKQAKARIKVIDNRIARLNAYMRELNEIKTERKSLMTYIEERS